MYLFEQTHIQTPDFNKTKLADYYDPSVARYHHILGVVCNMESLLPQINIPNEWKSLLIQTCYLHDIGYSSKLNHYHYHQLDGAIFAAKQNYPKCVIATILFHSCAYEGVLYSRPDLQKVYETHLAQLDDQDRLFIDLVSYCDLHTSAAGERTTLEQRVRNVAERYGQAHEVSKIMFANVPHFQAIIRRVTKLIQPNNPSQ